MERLRFEAPKETCLWRYLTIDKAISFFSKKEFRFTRSDKFNDPMECASFFERMAIQSKIAEVHIEDIKKAQRRSFVSCFYACSNESAAMWRMYSDPSSIALRFNGKELINFFKQKSDHDKKLEKYRIFGKQVEYKGFEIKEGMKSFGFSSGDLSPNVFIKDKCFDYEKEYRVVIFSMNARKYFKEISINSWDELKFDIIFHPNMPAWQKDNIRALVQTFNVGKNCCNSDIMTKFNIHG